MPSKPALDPLASRLKTLLTDGHLNRSQLSAAMRRRLADLFDLKILDERRVGNGHQIVVVQPEAFAKWINHHYPSGLDGHEIPDSPRAEAVANRKNSKQGRSLSACLATFRGFNNAKLMYHDGQSFDVARLTQTNGIASALIDSERPLQLEGTLVLVENQEVFMDIERLIPFVDLALWTKGKADRRIFTWLASQPNGHVIHAGDYDATGLREYLRLTQAVSPSRVTLYIPHDFERLLVTYGSPTLIQKSVRDFAHLRKQNLPELQHVLAIIDRHGRALEQEALLIDL